MDVLGPYPSGGEGFDVLICDFKPEDFPGRISQALGTTYLANLETRSNPVKGIVFNPTGSTLQILVTLPVAARGQSVATHFIFDTCAPCSYVAQSVLDALHLPEISFCSEVVKINGVNTGISVSDTTKVSYVVGDHIEERPCHFAGLNILGMDYLDRAGIKLGIDMQTNAVLLSSAQFPDSL